jgi:CheY-like chemotaxis protein
MDKKALGTYEIAEICHVSPTTVGNWVDKGLLPTFTTGGGHRRVWADDLVAFLNKHNIPVPNKFASSNGIRVLVVDDEEHVRSLIHRYLKKAFPIFEIVEAQDGFEAGQKVTQFQPHLLILDLKLPGMDGFKVCQLLRSHESFKNMKILAISGYNVNEYSKKAMASGANDFLGKPFEMEDLKVKVEKLLETGEN